jgi:hypothetical protein
MSWIRVAKLALVNDNNLFDVSELHFKFQTVGSDGESPNTADITIYNPSKDTAKTIQKEFDRVVIQAGYEDDATAVIFTGTIKQFYVGKLNNTDSYLRILASDGDIFHNFGFISTTIPAGTKPEDILKTLTPGVPWDPNNSSVGIGGIIPPARGKVILGLCRDYLRDITKMPLLKWSIQNGKFTLIPVDGYLPGFAVDINSQTGMVGIPEATSGGVFVRTLLNPKVRIGYQVRINQADLNINSLSPNSPTDPTTGVKIPSRIGYPHYESATFLADTSADGFYRVLAVEHLGNTRGDEWYTDITCLKLDNPAKKDNSVPV